MTLLRKIFSFATLTLLVAIMLSSVAAWYSIQGLMAIFAAAVFPIIVMGGSLEFAKVVTTVWLHKYWNRADWVMKAYLVPAVVALALLTSMGIFGFLSKAHSDQSLISGDVGAKIAVYDQKIETANANIVANRKALEQMDAQVDQLLGRTADDKGANRAVQVRKQQKSERARLNQEIQDDQALIAKTNEEAAPVRAEVRKVEAEVGPIKYIAALIYGDNPNGDLLERAVRWVIILIVLVFDPLALTLMLAAQSSYKWLEEDEEAEKLDGFKEALAEAFAPTEEVADDGPIQEDDAQLDDGVGEPLQEDDLPGPVEDAIEVEQVEDESRCEAEVSGPETTERPVVDIRTEGVTLEETEDGAYVQFEGKSTSKVALLGMHPELFRATVDGGKQANTNFGTVFPTFAQKGDVFVRVDMLPNRVYKFDSTKWIEVNKNTTDSYLYDDEYIGYLVSKIDSGEYDVDLLSENERVQIENYLQTQPK
jgi:hypothetical protein